MRFLSIVTLLSLVMNAMSFSAPSHRLSDGARSFLKNRHEMGGHRLNYKISGKKDSYKSYVVNVDGTSIIRTNLKKKLQEKFEVRDFERNGLEIRKKNYRLDFSKIKKSCYDNAQSILNSLLPDAFVNQFDLLSVDTVRSFSLSQGVRDESYTFNFSRLYNNRIVRSENNYLKVYVENDGYLKWAQIMMEDFSLTSDVVETGESIEENEIVLDSVLRADFEFFKEYDDSDGSIENVKTESVEVGSVASSYCEVNSDDGKKLFPCISYASKIKLANGNTFSYIVDVPHSRKSWEKFRHGKKNIRFVR